jgi:hypothetical protein
MFARGEGGYRTSGDDYVYLGDSIRQVRVEAHLEDSPI